MAPDSLLIDELLNVQSLLSNPNFMTKLNICRDFPFRFLINLIFDSEMKIRSSILLLLLLPLLLGCRSEEKKETATLSHKGTPIAIEHASGFSITNFGSYRILTIQDPWPNSEKSFRYLLYEAGAEIPEGIDVEEKIEIPVGEIVVTSTTHIPSLEALGEEKSLVGFPGLQYISSENTRKLIAEGKIRELGQNEDINTEILLDLRPDVVIGFAVDGSNKTFNTITKSGIPVVYNSDWTESSPLGKAEWIKFFGAFFNKIDEATAYFEEVEKDYQEAKELALKAEQRPTVMAGSMWKDQWFMPTGESWHGQFFKDANAHYLYEETEGTGSLALSIESVLTKAKDAEFWVGPAQFQTYEELKAASPHYTQFEAFQNRNIYTFSSQKGETGGVLFYEMAPNRPDLVLKDLISIFHPGLLPDYETTFYKPLE